MNEISLKRLEARVIGLINKYNEVFNDNAVLRHKLGEYKQVTARLEALLAKIKEEKI